MDLNRSGARSGDVSTSVGAPAPVGPAPVASPPPHGEPPATAAPGLEASPGATGRSPRESPAKLVRTPTTWLYYGALGVYGWYLYGFSATVPLLRDEQGSSRAVASLHGTAAACGAIVAGFVYARLVRRFGRGRVTWWSLGVLIVGVLALVSVPSVPAATIACALVAGIAGSVLVNGIAPAMLDMHGPSTSGAAVTEANATATGSGLLAPLAVGVGVAAGVGWRPGIAAFVVLVLLLVGVARVTGTRLPDARSAAPVYSDGAAGPLPRLPARYWLAWGVLVCCISAEFCTTLWASDVLRTHTGAGAAFAASAVTAVVGGMFVGRLFGARLAVGHPASTLLLIAIAVCAAGALLFWASPTAPLALAGLAVTGLGIALHYPLAVNLALAVSGGQTDRAAGYASYAAGLAIGAGPFVLGALADQVGPHTAFLIVPVLLGAAATGVLAVRRASPAL